MVNIKIVIRSLQTTEYLWYLLYIESNTKASLVKTGVPGFGDSIEQLDHRCKD